MRHLITIFVFVVILFALAAPPNFEQAAAQIARADVERALRKAAEFYWKKVSTQGGYHYYYAEDLSYGRSEHSEGPTQIETQREATPVVGLAYLRAWEA